MSEMEPGRWWRVIDADGKLWCETSDGEKARRLRRLAKQPASLERLYTVTLSEWRDEA
jgi:hypothetical protein